VNVCKRNVEKKVSNVFVSGHLYLKRNKFDTSKLSPMLLTCVEYRGGNLALHYVESGILYMVCKYCEHYYTDVTDKYCLTEKGND
jgi:hypothetical protein